LLLLQLPGTERAAPGFALVPQQRENCSSERAIFPLGLQYRRQVFAHIALPAGPTHRVPEAFPRDSFSPQEEPCPFVQSGRDLRYTFMSLTT
jgi:hypothetical protein